MPAFVRPAWLVASADDRATPVGLGPRKRDGVLWATITLRTLDGEVSEGIELQAGRSPARMTLQVPRGFAVATEADSRGTTLIIRPMR